MLYQKLKFIFLQNEPKAEVIIDFSVSLTLFHLLKKKVNKDGNNKKVQ